MYVKQTNHNTGGVGFLGLLFIVFLVLKLLSIITWSWWWVTAPLWGPLALFISVLIVGTAFILIKGK